MFGHFVAMQMQLKLHTLIVGELSYFWRWSTGQRRRTGHKCGWHDYRDFIFEYTPGDQHRVKIKETSNLKY